MILNENVLKNIIREVIEDFVDEANYPSSFNIDEFKALTSFNARLQYCKTHLELIASGSGRYVFGIDNDTVLKLAKNQKGVAQNEAEYEYANDAYISIIAEVYDYDDNFFWIEMERLSKCTPAKFKMSTGMNFKEFANDLQYNYFTQLTNKRPWIGRSDSYDENNENEFFRDVFDLVGSWNMPVGDLTRLSTYGITKSGDVKIVDAGLSSDVWDNYYKK